MAKLNVDIVTPERRLVSTPADEVVAPAAEGLYGVRARPQPLPLPARPRAAHRTRGQQPPGRGSSPAASSRCRTTRCWCSPTRRSRRPASISRRPPRRCARPSRSWPRSSPGDPEAAPESERVRRARARVAAARAARTLSRGSGRPELFHRLDEDAFGTRPSLDHRARADQSGCDSGTSSTRRPPADFEAHGGSVDPGALERGPALQRRGAGHRPAGGAARPRSRVTDRSPFQPSPVHATHGRRARLGASLSLLRGAVCSGRRTDAEVTGEQRELGPVVLVELAVEARDVGLHRALGDLQRLGDDPVVRAGRDPGQDLAFPRREGSEPLVLRGPG